MASFEFSLNNGLALIMPSGGSTACGRNFTAGRDDVVFQLTGEYSMTIDGNGNVTVTLYNMHGLIFPNKANYSAWFYFDTVWARNHNNCMYIALDVATTRQAHGGWSDGNAYWHQQVTGWKGGTGIRGYDQWIKYRYDIVEPACAGEYVASGCCNGGGYIGSAKAPAAQVFNLGQVDFETTKGFWIGANLNCYAGGWEQWQFVPFPITMFTAPNISVGNMAVNVCEEYAEADITLTSSASQAATGGTWELQYSTSSDFSNSVNYTKVNDTNTVTFDNVNFAINQRYFVRGRVRVSDVLYSNWVETVVDTTGSLMPAADAIALDISEYECNALEHGILVEGGLVPNGL